MYNSNIRLIINVRIVYDLINYIYLTLQFGLLKF